MNRSVAFYRDVMGFDLLFQLEEAAFLSAGGYHHHIGLNTWGTAGMEPDGLRRPGLYHFALNYPTRQDLARAVKRIVEAGHFIRGASDHTSHLAVYLSDPDGNGIELAWDRAPEVWKFMIDGSLTAEDLNQAQKRLDLAALIAEADQDSAEHALATV
ncbi:VOC family protein [Ensifer psoraleae]|uniref:VOC family protein n=1 Tax=Sinorhizobium psoraleae TaxID=520838 RepID=A0ABT4KPJ0_9HYPH|nr:VOC family protein [Sinorhizobium psoraleae]